MGSITINVHMQKLELPPKVYPCDATQPAGGVLFSYGGGGVSALMNGRWIASASRSHNNVREPVAMQKTGAMVNPRVVAIATGR